ncbi:MAG TPA: cupin domain-containing protein [Candidatus Sulfotelmatobacter sp.]|jgi:quercetin dioxygenase-like cupin family protein|nr:cupin domain-containing protein [Candidatus Sulfotelmatobacter sp.]
MENAFVHGFLIFVIFHNALIGFFVKVLNVTQLERKEIENNPLFFGGKVNTQSILQEEHKGKNIQVMMVNFAPGARNKLHTHTTEQILIVTEGKGIVATQDKEHIVTPGMIIYVPPNEAHWHGATKDSAFSHISILGHPHELKILGK